MRTLQRWANEVFLCVMKDTTITDNTREVLIEALRALMANDESWVKSLSETGSVFDQWLEHGCPREWMPVSPVEMIPPNVWWVSNLMIGVVCASVHEAPSALYAANRIRAFRTVFYGLKKWRLKPKEHTNARADQRNTRECPGIGDIRRFLDCQRDLLSRASDLANLPLTSVDVEVRQLLHQVLCGYSSAEFKPRIGPGAVFEGLSALQKWRHLTMFDDGLWARMGVESYRSGVHHLSDDPSLTEGDVAFTISLAKIVAVPKSMWEYRVITVPGNHEAYGQQGQRSKLFSCLSNCHLTRHINLVDQIKQQLHARSASVHGDMATLDLTDASNYVLKEQVRRVFPSDVSADLQKTWAEGLVVPELLKKEYGAAVPLVSYDGMGNATTFIVEVLMFWAYCQVIACRCVPERERRPVYVYGDDIIVDYRAVGAIAEEFTRLGWKLNQKKSFSLAGGVFRESCGLHAWRGHDVTPVRFHGYSDSVEDGLAVCAKINQCREIYPSVSAWLIDEFEIPNLTNAPKGGVCVDIDSHPRSEKPYRYNPQLQNWEYYVTKATTRQERSRSNWGWTLVLASLLGFSYCTYPGGTSNRRRWDHRNQKWIPENIPHVKPWYCATRPRRVVKTKGWLPTSQCGGVSVEDAYRAYDRQDPGRTRALKYGVSYPYESAFGPKKPSRTITVC